MKQVNGIFLPDGEKHFAEVGYVGERYPVLDAALQIIPEDRRRTAIDIGAHVGLWSKHLVHDFDYVHAFEPVQEFYEIMPHNMNGAKNYRLHDVALGSSYDWVGMKVYPENTGQTHVGGTGGTLMLPLDYYQFDDVDLVKIDVEGYELQVCRGAERTLKECRPLVIIEERATAANNFALPSGDARKHLESLGMKTIGQVHYDYIMGWT